MFPEGAKPLRAPLPHPDDVAPAKGGSARGDYLLLVLTGPARLKRLSCERALPSAPAGFSENGDVQCSRRRGAATTLRSRGARRTLTG
jgi:hypothetical protein